MSATSLTARTFIPETLTTFCKRSPNPETLSIPPEKYWERTAEFGTTRWASAAGWASVPTVPCMLSNWIRKKNEVVLGYEEECYKEALVADGLTWLSVPPLAEKTEIQVRLRSSQAPVAAEFLPQSADTAAIRFFSRQKAVAAGQSAVFYDNDGYVLGGGFIKGTQNAAV